MTTRVTVTTHDWPAEFRTFPLQNGVPVADGEWSAPTRVDPNSSREFVVHSGQDVMVRELPLETTLSPAPPT